MPDLGTIVSQEAVGLQKVLFIHYGKCNGIYLENNDMLSKVEKLYTRRLYCEKYIGFIK